MVEASVAFAHESTSLCSERFSIDVISFVMASDSSCHSPVDTVHDETKGLLSFSVPRLTCFQPCHRIRYERNHMLLSFSSCLMGLTVGIMFAYLFFPSLLAAQDYDRPLSYSQGSSVLLCPRYCADDRPSNLRGPHVFQKPNLRRAAVRRIQRRLDLNDP